MTYPVAALTTPQQTMLRSDGQSADLRMAVFTPTIIFQAQVNQATIDNDSIVQIAYDTVTSGSYTAVLAGMDMWVGSGSGLSDLGIARIRKSADATNLYIGATSDVAFADNAYLTVVKYYTIWPKHPRNVGADSGTVTWYMDYDVAYTDQYTYTDPVPVLGPSLAVLKIPASGSATLARNASNSWSADGASITGYSWAVSSGSVTNPTSASPTFTFTTPGSYVIDCTVTTSNSKTNKGHRYAFVYNDANPPTNGFKLDSCVGDASQGGWTAAVTMYDQATMTLIRDRALVAIFSNDVYGTSGSVMGQVSGYENIVMTGYVDGQTIEYNGELGTLQFTIKGAGPWMDNITSWSQTITDMHVGNSNWIYMDHMTMNKAMWQLAHWRSTTDTVIDVYPSGDTHSLANGVAPIGTLYQQYKKVGYQAFITPLIDRYNRMFLYPDCQMIPVSARSSIPTIQTITKNDWTGEVNITRMAQTPVSMLDISGIVFDPSISGSSLQSTAYGMPVLSRHPGFQPHQYGKQQTRDQLIFSSQTDCNNVCGLLGGKLNNEYPQTNIQLAQMNRMVDIAPYQYVVVNMDAADNPRGIAWSSKRFIPIRVSHKHDPAKGTLTTDLELEAETFQLSSATIIVPPVVLPGVGPITIPKSDFPIDFTPQIYIPPYVPVPPITNNDCSSDNSAPANSFGAVYDTQTITSGQSARVWFPCIIRKSTAINLSNVNTNADVDPFTDLSITAIDGSGNDVLSPSISDGLTATFSPAAATSVSGFKVKNIAVTSGSGIDYGTVWTDTGSIQSWTGGPVSNGGSSASKINIPSSWLTPAYGSTPWGIMFVFTGVSTGPNQGRADVMSFDGVTSSFGPVDLSLYSGKTFWLDCTTGWANSSVATSIFNSLYPGYQNIGVGSPISGGQPIQQGIAVNLRVLSGASSTAFCIINMYPVYQSPNVITSSGVARLSTMTINNICGVS